MIREGFISNSSSTSFIIRSKINLKDKENYDKVTNHDHRRYESVYNQIVNPIFDGYIELWDDKTYDFSRLPNELVKEIREAILQLESNEDTPYTYKVYDFEAQGWSKGLEGLFTDKNVYLECRGFESDPPDYVDTPASFEKFLKDYKGGKYHV